MHRALLCVVVVTFAFAAFAETGKERNARVYAEWDKYETQAENVCLANAALYFGYSPLDKRTFQPLLFSSSLQPDLLKRIADGLALKDQAMSSLIGDTLNAEFNGRIEKLRGGTYNYVRVILKGGPSFGITPYDRDADAVLVWLYRGRWEGLLDFAAGTTPKDKVNVLGPDGSLVRMDDTTRPRWLASEDLFTQAEGNYRSASKREKLYTKCDLGGAR